MEVYIGDRTYRVDDILSMKDGPRKILKDEIFRMQKIEYKNLMKELYKRILQYHNAIMALQYQILHHKIGKKHQLRVNYGGKALYFERGHVTHYNALYHKALTNLHAYTRSSRKPTRRRGVQDSILVLTNAGRDFVTAALNNELRGVLNVENFPYATSSRGAVAKTFLNSIFHLILFLEKRDRTIDFLRKELGGEVNTGNYLERLSSYENTVRAMTDDEIIALFDRVDTEYPSNGLPASASMNSVFGPGGTLSQIDFRDTARKEKIWVANPTKTVFQVLEDITNPASEYMKAKFAEVDADNLKRQRLAMGGDYKKRADPVQFNPNRIVVSSILIIISLLHFDTGFMRRGEEACAQVYGQYMPEGVFQETSYLIPEIVAKSGSHYDAIIDEAVRMKGAYQIFKKQSESFKSSHRPQYGPNIHPLVKTYYDKVRGREGRREKRINTKAAQTPRS